MGFVFAPNVNPLAGAACAPGVVAPEPNPNPPCVVDSAGAPNANVDDAFPAPPAPPVDAGAPNVNDIPAGLAAIDVEVGVADPNVKLGVAAGVAATFFCGESSIISPPLGVRAEAGSAPAPAPNPNPPALELTPPPKPLAAPLAAPAAAPAGAPNEKLLGGSLLAPPSVLAGAPNPNVNVPLGVVVPDAGAEVVGEEAAAAGAPNEKVGAGADGLASGAALLPVLALVVLAAPNVNPPAEAGFAKFNDVALALPNVNPLKLEAGPAGLDAPDPIALLSEAGLPNENPPLVKPPARSGASSPFAPNKLGTALDVAADASSFFSEADAARAPKLNPALVGALGVDAAAGALNEKLGMLFLAAGSSSPSALRLDPVEALCVDGVPKLNPPAADDGGVEPKNDDLLAGVSSFFFSPVSAGFDSDNPNAALAGTRVLADSLAGFAAPKLKGAGLLFAASAPVLLAAADAPKENPPVLVGAAEGASADLLSNFFMVLPKKLGTGPSFLASVSDLEAGSTGLLKKSDVGGAVDLFVELSSSFAVEIGAVLAPKLNLGIVLGASLEGAEKENDGIAAAGLGSSFFSVVSVEPEESMPPRRPSKEPPVLELLEVAGLATGSEVVSTFFAAAVSLDSGVSVELPNEKPDGNMLVGSLIFARSLASGKSSCSSSSSQALNLPEL